MSISSEVTRIQNGVTTQAGLISQIQTALASKATPDPKGGDYNIIQTVDGNNCSLEIRDASNPISLQPKSVTYTSNGSATVTPDSGYDGLSSVSVTVNVSGGVEPRLPAAYQELEWVECNGNQYISLGNNIKFDNPFFDSAFELNVSKTGGPHLLSHSTENFWIVPRMTNSLVVNIGGRYYETTRSDLTTRTLYRLERRGTHPNNLFLNGDMLAFEAGTNVSAGEAVLFAYALNKTGSNWTFVGRFYWLKIWDGEQLRYDLVPCYRKSDGKPGLYDVVTETFFVNNGTGEFIKGAEIETVGKNVSGILSITQNGSYDVSDKAYVVVGITGTEIPSAYKQVEYLQSNGSQYIDTGVNHIDGVDVQFKFVTAENRRSVFGARDSDSGDDRFSFTIWDSKFLTLPGGYLGNMDTNIHTLRSGSNFSWKVILDGTEITTASYVGVVDNSTVLFAENYIGAYGFSSACRIYRCKLFSGNVCCGDYVPCVRLSDSKPGMWDRVNNVFLVNNGSGEFSVGGDI